MSDPVDNNGDSYDSPDIPKPETGGPTPENLMQQYGNGTKPDSTTPKDAKTIDAFNNYPPGDHGPDADKIQFNSNGTATLWTKDPDLKGNDPNNPRSPYAIDGFIDNKGTVHYLSEKDYADVQSGKVKIDDVMNAYMKK